MAAAVVRSRTPRSRSAAGRWCGCLRERPATRPSTMLDIDRTRLLADAATVHLADMLVAMAIFGSVSAAMFTVLQEGLRVYAVGVSRAESQQSGRVAVERSEEHTSELQSRGHLV